MFHVRFEHRQIVTSSPEEVLDQELPQDGEPAHEL